MRKVQRALDRHDVRALLVGGGVVANARLRAGLEAAAQERGLDLRMPPPPYCVDNAAMIAGLAAVKLAAGALAGWSLSASTQSAISGGRVAV
jgi:N6-L-threonylcarbamoyladenine synthase